jgi:hypothetical protein
MVELEEQWMRSLRECLCTLLFLFYHQDNRKLTLSLAQDRVAFYC